MKLDVKKTNIKYNNYSGLPFEMQLLKAIKYRISDFDKRRISEPKKTINKLAMNNRRLLIAPVLHFVLPVEKDK